MGTTKDIAGAALFLASDMSSYVTGQKIKVAGGAGHVLPHPATFLMSSDNKLANK